MLQLLTLKKFSDFDADISETLKKVWFSTTVVQSQLVAVSRPFKYMNSPIFTFKIFIMETKKLQKAPKLQSSTIVFYKDKFIQVLCYIFTDFDYTRR